MNKQQREKYHNEIRIYRLSKSAMHQAFKEFGKDSPEGMEARQMFRTDIKVLKDLKFSLGMDKEI